MRFPVVEMHEIRAVQNKYYLALACHQCIDAVTKLTKKRKTFRIILFHFMMEPRVK